MNWTELLRTEMKATYSATFHLLEWVDDSELAWKPETGHNWMTVGQLLMHLTMACGFCCRGFVTGDWTVPEGAQMTDESGEEMLPIAENMPAVESVAQARDLLMQDQETALDMIERAGENDLANKQVAAPWFPEVNRPLGVHCKHMIDHLAQHKGQLFCYLKLQNKPVNTHHLWGMTDGSTIE